MKNQLTALLTLASLGWSVSTLANISQPSLLQPVNSTLMATEINLELPQLDIKASIIDQVSKNLQPQTVRKGTLLIARESTVTPGQQTTTRTE